MSCYVKFLLCCHFTFPVMAKYSLFLQTVLVIFVLRVFSIVKTLLGLNLCMAGRFKYA